MKERIKRRDLTFLGIILFLGVMLLLLQRFVFTSEGAVVQVSVDGALYGSYPLNEDQTISIADGKEATNVVEISQGKVHMKEADCPDKLCEKQGTISKSGETIVCLPNKVVLTVISSEKSSFDSVAK